jgi:hypothetical protein
VYRKIYVKYFFFVNKYYKQNDGVIVMLIRNVVLGSGGKTYVGG